MLAAQNLDFTETAIPCSSPKQANGWVIYSVFSEIL